MVSKIDFLASCAGKPVFHDYRQDLDNLPLESITVTIEDLRSSSVSPSLDQEGFTIVRHHSKVENFHDAEAVRNIYLRELETLLHDTTGAAKIVPSLGISIRRSVRSPNYLKDSTTIPGCFAHCDFSPNPAGSAYWVKEILPADEVHERLKKRFAIFNIWKVLSDPPQDYPLAICDARTVGAEELVCSDCVIDSPDSPLIRFETSIFRHGPKQRWCFFSDMNRNELLVFKGYDSDRDRASCVPHAAFNDPNCPSDAPARESIDVRFLAFFDE